MELFVDLAAEDSRLDSSAIGDSFVRVDASVRLLAVEELLDQGLDFGDPGGASHEHDLIDFAAPQPRVLHDLLNRLQGVLKEVIDELINEDLDLSLRRQVSLGPLNLRFELLQGSAIGSDIDAVLLLEDLHQVVCDSLIEVLTSEMSITGRGEHLKHAIVDRED